MLGLGLALGFFVRVTIKVRVRVCVRGLTLRVQRLPLPIKRPRKNSRIVLFVITSPCREWVRCAPAAFPGCGRLILALELPQFSK